MDTKGKEEKRGRERRRRRRSREEVNVNTHAKKGFARRCRQPFSSKF